MNQEQLAQALRDLKAALDELTKRQIGKAARAGALAGALQVHASFATDELIDSQSGSQLDIAADQWLGFLGAEA